jgi:hypothetical protein
MEGVCEHLQQFHIFSLPFIVVCQLSKRNRKEKNKPSPRVLQNWLSFYQIVDPDWLAAKFFQRALLRPVAASFRTSSSRAEELCCQSLVPRRSLSTIVAASNPCQSLLQVPEPYLLPWWRWNRLAIPLTLWRSPRLLLSSRHRTEARELQIVANKRWRCKSPSCGIYGTKSHGAAE